MKIGKIPKRLKMFCCEETSNVRFRWTDVEFEDHSAIDIAVTPTYVTDADNTKTQKSAEAWCQRDSENIWTSFEAPNDPVDSVRIIGLSVRGHGGRAYQALINEKYLVDMREDVMLDSMINCGMSKNAVLNGEYIFAQIGSEMKLIRVGSKLHELMVEATAFGEKKIIENLIPGHIYSSKTKTVLYVGEVWHTRIDNPIVTKKRHLYVRVDEISKDLNVVLGKDTTYFIANVEFGEVKSKAYREDHGQIENFDTETVLSEIRRKIEIGYHHSLSRGYATNLCYYSAMNISINHGYIHPEIQKRL